MISYFVSCSITLINRSLHRSRFLMQRKKYLNFIANRSFSARTGWRWNFFLPDWSALKMGGLRWNSNIFFFALNFFFSAYWLAMKICGLRSKWAVCDQIVRFATKQPVCYKIRGMLWKWAVRYKSERYAIKVSGMLSKWVVCYKTTGLL